MVSLSHLVHFARILQSMSSTSLTSFAEALEVRSSYHVEAHVRGEAGGRLTATLLLDFLCAGGRGWFCIRW
jgi:hypothetical protein